MRDYLAVAVEAAKLGGDILREYYRRVKTVEFKGETDLVTDVDRRSEKEIVDLLTSRFPHHSILAEEGTSREKSSEFKWVIDPLDGTTNYAHGYPGLLHLHRLGAEPGHRGCRRLSTHDRRTVRGRTGRRGLSEREKDRKSPGWRS